MPAVIQSSTAVTVMTIGFVGVGLDRLAEHADRIARYAAQAAGPQMQAARPVWRTG